MALAIACICSLGSTWAAPTFAQSSCQAECNQGEYCNEKSGSPECIPCFNCTAHDREPGPAGCAKSVAECGVQKSDSPDFPDYNSESGEDYSANTTGLDTSFRNANTGHEERPTKKPDPNPTQRPDHGRPKDTLNDYVTPILTTAGILAAIVIGLVCALGRRPYRFAQGGLEWAKRGRTGAAHFRIVPQGDELAQPGDDPEVEFYDHVVHRPARNEDDGQAVLVGLLADELREQHPGDPVAAQQPPDADPNRLLDEVAVHLDRDGALALPDDNIPEGENPARNVPEDDDELGQPGTDGDVEFYDDNEGQPARHEDEALGAFVVNGLFNPPPAAPAQSQQTDPGQQGDEDAVPLDPHEVAALLANNINDAMEAAAPQEGQEDYVMVEVQADVEAHMENEAGLEGDNDGNQLGDQNESENDSDDDDDELAPDNPIVRISNNHPYLFEIVKIVNRVERESHESA